ncbi:MAG: AMP-binding protein [Pyrinomonadaceae bacterium]
MTKQFCERLIDACETHNTKVAMRVIGDNSEDVTFGELLNQIRSVAFRLEAAGVEIGDRVAVIGENHPCWAIAYLGALYRGAVCVPIDPHGEIETITNFIDDSESKIAFVSADFKERIYRIQETLGRAIETVVWRDEDSPNGFHRFEDWAQTEVPRSFAEAKPAAKPTDYAVMIYTSGTTGKPKGVLLSHKNITAEIDAIDHVLEFTDKESVLSLLPLFHAYLQVVNLWLSATKGAEVFYLKELTPDALSNGMVESKMTALASVPRLWYIFHKKIFDTVAAKPRAVQTLFRGMLRLNGFTRDTLNINLGKILFKQVHASFGGNLRLAVTAGSRFDSDVAIDFHRLGFTILQGYGLSETSGAATATHENDNRVGSVGKAMHGAEIKIADANDKGEGEVLIRGAMVFDGYYKNPEATAAAFTDDGWFRSGDIGKLDKDGNLYIVGRMKDVIVLPSGKNVHPEDLEVHYSKSPYIEEICILGVEDDSIGRAGAEKLVAVAVPDFEYLRVNNIVNSREIIRFDLDTLGRELPEYQRVKDYIIRAEPLPRTATRKLKRFELQAELKSDNETFEPQKEAEFTVADRELLSSNAGIALLRAINDQKEVPFEVHPTMNIELDLRLDSLARAEVVAALEKAFSIELEAEDVAKAFTVQEMIELVNKSAGTENAIYDETNSTDWSKIITESNSEDVEVDSIVKPRPLFSIFAFIVLKIVYVFCRIFFRLEVSGTEYLRAQKNPFLICPNHQSYLDPIVVCSTYPYSVLKNSFHVGASMYFKSSFTRSLASLLSVVPIDADKQTLKSLKIGAAGLRHGKILNIYPEGERSYDGELHPFKKGAAILSTEMGLEMVPVALDGMQNVLARDSKRIKLAKVKVAFCAPIIPKPKKDIADDEVYYEELTKDLKAKISEKLVKLRT